MNTTKSKYGPSHRENDIINAKNMLGEYGKEVLTAVSNNRSGNCYFRQIQILTEAVFSQIRDNESPAGHIERLAGIRLAAGTVIYGKFWGLVIEEGIAICYKEIDEPFTESW